MPNILHNRIRCRLCGDLLESQTGDDLLLCSCGACGVDGGREYLRRVGYEEDYEELSEWEDET